MDKRIYKGKVILFGEYSMIYGSDALLMPYYSSHAQWQIMINNPSEAAFQSNKELYKFYSYLTDNEMYNILDLKRMKMELDAGLFFDSNIPLGYGAGSSGALVAATYDRYKLIEIEDVTKLKRILAEMENCFHGNSSGIDPLQCYYGKPFILTQNNNSSNTDNKQSTSLKILNDNFLSENIHIFLIDTKVKSQTGPLVTHFKDLRNNEDYRKKFDDIYSNIVDKCIYALIDKEDEIFFNNLSQLSDLQYEMLSFAIPDEIKEFFHADIKEHHFRVKLCGSGGGGFLLCFSNNTDKTRQFWEKKKYNILQIL